MKCPRCSKPLATTPYEGITVDECAGCKGVWVDDGELRAILDLRDKTFTSQEIGAVKGISQNAFGALKEEKGKVGCPKCSAAMTQVNYAGSTGIVLDRCASHGLWFDASELEHVQICVEGWEGMLEEDMAKYGPVIQKVKKDLHGRMISAMPGKHFKKSPILEFLVFGK
jgi:Zn-finger nucleic acid-binding protein